MVAVGVSAAEASNAYGTNEALADEKFTGQRTTVSGRMVQIRPIGTIVKDGDIRYDLVISSGKPDDGLLSFAFSGSKHRVELAKLMTVWECELGPEGKWRAPAGITRIQPRSASKGIPSLNHRAGICGKTVAAPPRLPGGGEQLLHNLTHSHVDSRLPGEVPAIRRSRARGFNR